MPLARLACLGSCQWSLCAHSVSSLKGLAALEGFNLPLPANPFSLNFRVFFRGTFCIPSFDMFGPNLFGNRFKSEPEGSQKTPKLTLGELARTMLFTVWESHGEGLGRFQ